MSGAEVVKWRGHFFTSFGQCLEAWKITHTHWQKQLELTVTMTKLFLRLPLLWSYSSSSVRLLSATLLSLLLPMNHKRMKQSRSSQVNTLWLGYRGNAGSNSQGDAGFRILPGTRTQNVFLLVLQWKCDWLLFIFLPLPVWLLNQLNLQSKCFAKGPLKTHLRLYFKRLKGWNQS